MIKLGFTFDDVKRTIWSFVFGAGAYLLLAQTSVIAGTADWHALWSGAVVAGLSAIKNLVLADGSKFK